LLTIIALHLPDYLYFMGNHVAFLTNSLVVVIN